MRKNWIAPTLAVVALTGVTLFSAHSAFAQTPTGSTSSSLIDKLVTKFNLNKDDVTKTFEEFGQEKQAEMETKFTAQLDTLVADGKITAAQKTAILAKRSELQAEMKAKIGDKSQTPQDFKNLTDAERKAKMEAGKTEMNAKKTELEAWAKGIGLDTQYLRLVGGFGGPGFGGHRGGPEGGRPEFDNPSGAPVTTP